MDLVSVIVPVYNVEKYLLRCVDSVRKQTYKNIEIILVDDGSPDRCPEICEQIKAQDSRVKVIHKENGGLGFARNSGLDIAAGEYVTFIDSDDWISEKHIENLYMEAKKTGADAAIGSHTTVSLEGYMRPLPIKIDQKVYTGAEIREKIVLPLIGADVGFPQDVQLESSCCMNLYRLDVISKNKLRFHSEKEAVAEDLCFNIDFFCNSNCVVALNEVGYYYFENFSSISRKYDSKRFVRTIRFYETINEQVLKYGLKDFVAFRVERTFLLRIRVAIRLIVFSDLPKREKYNKVHQVLNNNLVKEVLKSYPIDTYIPAMRLLAGMMRKGNVIGVYWLMRAREYAKSTLLLKIFLGKIGIGK